MRILVTAGNTLTMIDRVRAITNIFTGRTGAAIALEAERRGHDVTLLTSTQDLVEAPRVRHCSGFRTFEELETSIRMHFHVMPTDAVIHCAAVSDYLAAGVFAPAATTHFDGDLTWRDDCDQPLLLDRSAGKVKSDEPELWLRLVRAPKIIDKMRNEWGFKGTLVKFKLEVGISEDTLLTIAETSRRQSHADWMVANTLEGAAEWAFIGNDTGYHKVTRAELAGALLDVLEGQHA